jgi:hypothetical protein
LGQFFKAWFEFPVIKRRNAGSLWLLFFAPVVCQTFCSGRAEVKLANY